MVNSQLYRFALIEDGFSLLQGMLYLHSFSSPIIHGGTRLESCTPNARLKESMNIESPNALYVLSFHEE